MARNSLGFAYWRGRSFRPDGLPQKFMIVAQGGCPKVSVDFFVNLERLFVPAAYPVQEVTEDIVSNSW